MLLIKKKNLFYFITYHLASIFLLSILFYYTIRNGELSDPIQRKFFSEKIFFLMVVLTTVDIFCWVLFLKKNRNIHTELNKFIEYSQKHDIKEGCSFLNKLDTLGVQLNQLIRIINDVSDKRKTKLSSMYQLIDTIVSHYDKNLLVANIRGDIQYLSNKFAASVKLDTDLIRVLNLSDLLSVNFRSLLQQLEQEKREMTFKELTFTYQECTKKIKEMDIYPIYNSNGLLSNIIFSFTF